MMDDFAVTCVVAVGFVVWCVAIYLYFVLGKEK